MRLDEQASPVAANRLLNSNCKVQIEKCKMNGELSRDDRGGLRHESRLMILTFAFLQFPFCILFDMIRPTAWQVVHQAIK